MARTGGGRRGQSGGLTERLPLKLGGVFGVAAYVVGYIVTYVLVEIDGEIDTSEFDSEFADTIDVVGWVFYNGHFVDTEYSISAGDFSESESERLIAEGSTQIPEVVYYLVPIVMLVGAGYLLLQQEYVTDVGDAALSGATLVVGYLPLAILGTILFEASESGNGGSVSVGPETGAAILLAGLIWPIVLGAVGGFLASQIQDNTRRRR